MKRFFITIISLAVTSIVCAQDNEVFCRPVIDNKDVNTVDNVYTIRVFKEEWFKTQAKGNANARVLTDAGANFLATDGTPAILDINLRDSVSNHPTLDIKCWRNNDSLYIYVPVPSDNCNWYYVIDQTRNVKLDSITVFDTWISFPFYEDSTQIIRVSPQNHVTSFFKEDLKKNIIVETLDTCVIQENDTLLYNLYLAGNDTIRKVLIKEWTKANEHDWYLIAVIILVSFTLIAGGFAFWYYRRINKRNAFNPETDQKILFFFEVGKPQKQSQLEKFDEVCDVFPSLQELKKGQRITLRKKGHFAQKFYEVKEYRISKYWKEISRETLRLENKKITKTINDFILPSDPHNGDVVEVVLRDKMDGTWLFEYINEKEAVATSLLPVGEDDSLNGSLKISQDKSLETCLSLLPTEYSNIKTLIKDCFQRELQKKAINQNLEIPAKVTEITRSLDSEKERVCREYEKQINDVNKTKVQLEEKYNILKQEFDQKVQEEKNKIEKRAEKEIEKAKKELDEAIKQRNEISNKLHEQFEKEKKKLLGTIEEKEKKLKKTGDELRETKGKLVTTVKERDDSQNTVKRLEAAQKTFTDVLTYVPFAEEYSRKVIKLLDIVDRVNHSAVKLLDVESVEDPYHIMKSLAKYSKSIASIDIVQFYTDIKMITKGQMVLNDTTLATYNQNLSKEELHNSLKIYFFDTYLAKYIDAIIVLNESCIGLDKLVDGLTPDNVKVFLQYREELRQCVDLLEIEVETTHLFDKVGQKIDLRVTLIDAGFATGDILEIENCYVYLKGSQRPDTKIYVKAQS